MNIAEQPQVEETLNRHRWFSFTIRHLLFLMTLASCALGWIASERSRSKQERRFGQMLREQGDSVLLLGAYDAFDLYVAKKPQGWAKDLSRKILGERIFLIRMSDARTADLHSLGELTNLEFLSLQGVSITNLAPLRRMRCLRHLTLVGTPVSDLSPLASLAKLKELKLAGLPGKGLDLSPLANLSGLERLAIQNSNIVDLTPIDNLMSLQVLDLAYSAVDAAQIEATRNALPNCLIRQ